MPKTTAPRGRPFQRGADPRRHRFSREECQRGFWPALESIVERHPDAIMRDGHTHMVTRFLPAVIAKKGAR